MLSAVLDSSRSGSRQLHACACATPKPQTMGMRRAATVCVCACVCDILQICFYLQNKIVVACEIRTASYTPMHDALRSIDDRVLPALTVTLFRCLYSAAPFPFSFPPIAVSEYRQSWDHHPAFAFLYASLPPSS